MLPVSYTTDLARHLLQTGRLTKKEIDRLSLESKHKKQAFVRTLKAEAIFSESEIREFLEKITGFELCSLRSVRYGNFERDLMPGQLALKFSAVPLGLQGESVRVAMIDPLELAVRKELEFYFGRKIIPEIALISEVDRILADLVRFFTNKRELNRKFASALFTSPENHLGGASVAHAPQTFHRQDDAEYEEIQFDLEEEASAEKTSVDNPQLSNYDFYLLKSAEAHHDVVKTFDSILARVHPGDYSFSIPLPGIDRLIAEAEIKDALITLLNQGRATPSAPSSIKKLMHQINENLYLVYYQTINEERDLLIKIHFKNTPSTKGMESLHQFLDVFAEKIFGSGQPSDDPILTQSPKIIDEQI